MCEREGKERKAVHAGDVAAQQAGAEASDDSDGDELDLDRMGSHGKAGTSAAHGSAGVSHFIYKLLSCPF